jgi:large subunit ribosomal protein L25
MNRTGERTMSEVFELEAQVRENYGKAHSRRMRRLDNTVPAVIYGAGKDHVSITLLGNKVRKALQNEAFYSHILTIKVNGKKEKAVIKAIQRHPHRQEILHMDFLRINADEKLTMNVPVHFENEETAAGVKVGGVINHNMSEIEVSCLPADLPSFIAVDIENLEMDGVIHLSQVKLPKGVESVALALGEGHDFAVVSIHEPKVIEEPEEEVVDEEAEGEEGAEAAAEGEGGEKATDDKGDANKDNKKDGAKDSKD